MKEAILYEKMDNRRIKCKACRHYCVIPPGKRGECSTRINKDGTLYTLIYGFVSSACVDPIEKKPLYHFYPGTQVFSLGTEGCNFKCPGCQNWQISHAVVDESGRGLEYLSPEKAVMIAERTNSQGICWTYNEPSIWIEYTLEGAKLAKQKNLYTAYVTNGYASEEHIDLIGPYLDAYRVDIKGFSSLTYKKIARIARLENVLDGVKRARHKWNMHVECVTNVTPTINDDENELRELARWIKKELGEFTPWHITRFYPHLDLSHLPPTPVKKLERIHHIAKEEGLHYVYTGNVPGHLYENTFCHNCNFMLIKRTGFYVAQSNIKDGKCPKCNATIYGRFM